VVPPLLDHASRHSPTQAINKPPLLLTVEAPVNSSLTLSGAFDLALICRLPPSRLAVWLDPGLL